MNISLNNDWNLFWDAKILRTQEIMTLFKLEIPQILILFWSYFSWSPKFILLLYFKNRGPWSGLKTKWYWLNCNFISESGSRIWFDKYKYSSESKSDLYSRQCHYWQIAYPRFLSEWNGIKVRCRNTAFCIY